MYRSTLLFLSSCLFVCLCVQILKWQSFTRILKYIIYVYILYTVNIDWHRKPNSSFTSQWGSSQPKTHFLAQGKADNTFLVGDRHICRGREPKQQGKLDIIRRWLCNWWEPATVTFGHFDFHSKHTGFFLSLGLPLKYQSTDKLI